MQEHLPPRTNINTLSSIPRRINSYKYIERFPDTFESEFVCPCCGKIKNIKDARIKSITHESNSVGVRTIHTTTEKFEFRLCSDCYTADSMVYSKSTKLFWIAYGIVLAVGVIISFATSEFYAALAAVILGAVIAFYSKKAFTKIVSERIHTNVSYQRACDCNAIVK